MSKRKTPLINAEYYHIYNRGVDKRNIFKEEHDVERFIQGMVEFNTAEPIGSIYENSFRKKHQLGNQVSKLVEVIAYCLNPNHYHFILRQVQDDGISRFMKSLGGGYTKFFNEKYKRSGSLFQGKFQSIHISSGEQLQYVGAYVNLNYVVHGLIDSNNKPSLPLIRSSWEEYLGVVKNGVCTKDILQEQFLHTDLHKKDTEELVYEIAKKRQEMKELLLE